MKFAYFPGCSLKSTGRAYDESFRAVAGVLDIELEELDNWNCCGATAFMSIKEADGYAVSIRNLAIAEETGNPMVSPCGGCYGVLLKAQHYFEKYSEIREVVNDGLSVEGMEYKGTTQIRHPLEIIARDIPSKALRSKVKTPLKGLKVACYYGCRFLRPEAPFDDQHNPTTMDTLMKGIGARVVDFNLKGKCCGGALAGTIPSIAQDLCYLLLKEAQKHEADVIATACPLCQFNVEAYQDEICDRYGDVKTMPVLYFTQLLGLAFGIEPKTLGLHRQMIPIEPVLEGKGLLGNVKAKEAVSA